MGVKGFIAGCALLAAVLAFHACSASVSVTAHAATKRVPDTKIPRFQDDLIFVGLHDALERQRAGADSDQKVVLGGVEYSAEHLRKSRERFHQLVRETGACLSAKMTEADREACCEPFQRAITNEFAIYTTPSPAHLTAYYTPTIDVASTPNGEFRFPIYGLPDSPQLRRLSREDIDFRGALAGQGLELYYARSRFDIYVLQVEGGGRIRIRSGGEPQVSYLSYAGNNGRRVRLIEEYMLQHGMLRREDVSRAAQRMFLQKHAKEAEQVYASAPWYVFFKEMRGPVLGSTGAALTANRSLASDPTHYPIKGLIVFVTATLPELPRRAVPLESNPDRVQYRRMARFFLDQDEGPYIKGAARFDLFFGEDKYAEFLASNLDTRGQVHFLVLKQRTGDR